MFAQIFQNMAIGFSEQFGGPFHAAVASWPGTPVMDSGGSIVTPGTPTNLTCHAQVDVAGERMRSAEGYAEGDISIIVIGLDALDTDANITIATGPHAGRWSLQSVDLDPVAVGYVCRGRKI